VRLVFTTSAWEDYLWLQENEHSLLKRTNQLIRDIMRSPFEGIGKPEPLKANLAGYWSRRIDYEHRIVYAATTSEILIISCRYHYSR
jgi:toxin YoeB